MQDFSKEFSGRKAFVTGGSRGIGAAIAQRLLDGGAEVVISARSKHEDTPAGATFIKGDISTVDGANALAREVLETLGGIDILINNAGSARVHLGGSAAIPDEEWLDALDLNFLSAVRTTNALLPALKESSNAAIVNISSGGPNAFLAPLLHYGAAKAALNTYSLGLAAELAPKKIRVNTVTPGLVVTPGADEIRKVFTDAMGVPEGAMGGMVPLGRMGQALEVAEVVALLASDRGIWITGQNYFVDGGMAAIGKK